MLDLIIIGGGKMGQALTQGIISSKSVDPESLGIIEASESGRSILEQMFPEIHILDRPVAARSTLIAVKPGDVEKLANALEPDQKQRVLSIAAGISTAALEVWFGGRTPVIRAMPNTPATIGLAMTAICAGRFASEGDLSWAATLLGGVGKVVVVKETQIDAVTAVSGSGPAYIFLIAEAMIDAAVAQGLSLDLAKELVIQTIYGSGALLSISAESPTALRQNVTSPGGTTAAGIRELEESAVRAAIAKAIAAARQRSVEIGGDLFKH